jgi:hypothetical protein
MGSLSEVFDGNEVRADFLQQLQASDKDSAKIRAYYLPGGRTKDSVKCMAVICSCKSRGGKLKDETSGLFESQPLMLCFFCNHAYHLKCVELDLNSIKEQKAPWRCAECLVDPNNEALVKYYTSTRYSKTIQSRRRTFLKDHSDEGTGYDTDGEYDALDVSAFASFVNAPKRTKQDEHLRLHDELIKAKQMTEEEKRRNQELEVKLNEQRVSNDRAFEAMKQQIEDLQKQIGSIDLGKSTTSNQAQSALNASVDAIKFYGPLGQRPMSERIDGWDNNFNPNTQKAASGGSNASAPIEESRENTPVNNANQQQEQQPPQQQPHTSRANPRQNSQHDETVVDVIARFANSQERMEQDKLLAARRKAMPKIIEFDGDAMKWLEFEKDVERYETKCKYDEETIKLHVRGALKGEAKEAVKDVFDSFTLAQIMGMLRDLYGDAMILVKRKARELKELKGLSVSYREDVVKTKVAIQGYFSACTNAKTGCLNSNELGELIYAQYGTEDKMRVKEMFVRKNPGKQIVICLNTIYEYLTERLPLLDERPKKDKDKFSSEKKDDKKPGKPYQLNAIASSSSTSSSPPQLNPFIMKDKIEVPDFGYDMEKVANFPKNCGVCSGSGHFAAQCFKFRDMDEPRRLKTIIEKKLCRNCLLTDQHRSFDCDVKLKCGMAIANNRFCYRKHHAAIHNITLANNARDYRSGSFNSFNNNRGRARGSGFNARFAKERVERAKQDKQEKDDKGGEASTSAKSQTGAASVAFHAIAPPSRAYDIRTHQLNMLSQAAQINAASSSNTVKMFKTTFFGPVGSTTCFAVGDSGAELSLVRNDLRIALGIQGVKEKIYLSWSDGVLKECDAVKFDLTVKGSSKKNEKILLKDCYAVDDLDLPPRTLDMEAMRSRFPYLKDVDFDGYYNEQPVMIIGSPHAFACESIKSLISGGYGCPVAIESKLGASVYGGMPSQCSEIVRSVHAISEQAIEEEESRISNEDLHRLLILQNSIESLGIKPVSTQQTENEKKAVEILTEEMRQLPSGNVEVPLIWNRFNKEIPEIENNYKLAYKRQLANEAKLRKNPEHLEMFNNCIRELMRLGYLRHAEEKDLKGKWKNEWYMPTSMVINPNKHPPKPRIVYDVSARYNQVSLNDLLLKGPDLLIDLVKPIFNMRTCRIAFTADVQQMFHRMSICLRDQQCQRLLWREDPDKPMKTLILSVMAFGPTCSPFVSQFVKNWNADRYAHKYPEAARALKESVYMDDFAGSAPNVRDASKLANQLIEICKAINWNLLSFQSNSIDFLKSLPGNNVKKEIIPIMSELNEGYVTKVLGCNWNTSLDCYVYEINKNIFVQLVKDFKCRPTKRDLASTIPRIFDLLGFIVPFTIRGKILLQRTWRAGIDWDDHVPDDIQRDWCKWLEDAENIEKLRIPRMYANLNALDMADEIQLHVFCDAGIEAYGCVSYFVVRHKGRTDTGIVMAKAKVTPLRIKTETEVKEIPRLELMSALIATRLGKTITDNHKEIKFSRFFWSDSEVVLRWIHNKNVRLLKYAIGPIEEILDHTQREEWRYVPTAMNPADLCTKFKKMDFGDSHSSWFTGPEFLKKNEECWPQVPEKLKSKEQSIAVINNIYLQKLKYSSQVLPPVDCPIANDDAVDKLSASIKASWPKLVRATARALKLHFDGLIPLTKSKDFNDKFLRSEIKDVYKGFRGLKAADLERAEHFLFRKIQRKEFAKEYEQLAKGGSVSNKDFQKLNVFMDKEGLLRINSRVNLNSLTFPQQFAPLLPRKNDLVSVLLKSYHERYQHITLESQIADLRTKCWVLQVRTALQEVKKGCNECNLRNAQTYTPEMAPLPEYRVNEQLDPFEVTGIDAFGPITVIVYGRPKKIWVLIFVCTMTRFIHLHIIESLESLRVLEAIVVFWSAHGPVRKFVSDNGTNFVGAANLLKQDFEETNLQIQQQADILAPKLSQKYNVDWEFIPPGSPWCGGFYERLIKEVKRSIFNTLNQRKIQKIELNIALQEAAHRINLRPLTYNSVAAEDDVIMTPHLLAKKRHGWPLLPGIHKGKYAIADDKSIYRRGRQVADEIMRKFTAYYLPVLTKQCKWFNDKTPIKVDDLVLLIAPNETRKEWKRGRVVKVKRGKDGKGRVADVMISGGVIKTNRSVRNLAKIAISQ